MKIMTENFKILTEFVKDMSSETPDVQTYLFVKDNISKYHLDINVASKALKNKLVEVNTTLKFEDKELNEKKSHFEMTYVAIVKIDEGGFYQKKTRIIPEKDNGNISIFNFCFFHHFYAHDQVPNKLYQYNRYWFNKREYCCNTSGWKNEWKIHYF